MPEGTALLEAQAYKGTTSSVDHVVHRKICLYKGGKLCTFHARSDRGPDKRTWYIDWKCVLGEIALVNKLVRPSGTWAITASVRRRGQAISLVRPGACMLPVDSRTSPMQFTLTTPPPSLENLFLHTNTVHVLDALAERVGSEGLFHV